MADQADDLGIPMRPERQKAAMAGAPTVAPKANGELAETPAFLQAATPPNPVLALAPISSRLADLNRPGTLSVVPADSTIEARKLVVGPGTALSGEINSCDWVIVEGSVMGNLQQCQHMIIAEDGRFDGNASINDAEIRGRFQGELTVRGRLVIHRSGNVSGSIKYAEIEIEAGGRISGIVKLM